MTSSNSISLTPPLKWAGGKRWLVPTLQTLIQHTPYTRLVEPFVGGLSVTLGLNSKAALLNDINPHLINFYWNLQNGLVISDINVENTPECYYSNRARFNYLRNIPCRENAELFYYLNRHTFNGLCRFNSKGEFNSPFGKYKSLKFIRDLTEYKATLSNWQFTCMDFSQLVLKPGDLLYIDPPYDTEFTKYSKEDFKWDDQVRLVNWLDNYPGPVVASNQATPRVIELYKSKGFTIKEVAAPRRISCNGDRRLALELLMWRNL